MASYLEAVPHDVLQHIAFLLATASVVEAPRHLLHLLLTSTTIRRSLDVHNSPHLYANIFRATFDVDTRLHLQLTDSTLALELHRRYSILWRSRRQDTSSDPTQGELWAALRMVLENEGRNEILLKAADFPRFITSFIRRRLATNTDRCPDRYGANSLAMWLLCLTLTHQDIINTPDATREEFRRSLRFPITPSTSSIKPALSSYPARGIGDSVQGPEQVSAAIIVAFALNEAVPLAIPTHIPQTRALAIASQRSGPTLEDFRTLTNHRTPLFAETRRALISNTLPAAYVAGSVHDAMHDLELCRILHASYSLPVSLERQYTPGALTGLWEGGFMISGLVSEPKSNNRASPTIVGDFQCLKPMQCAISEYLCFSPRLPLPFDYSVDLLETTIHSPESGYEKYSPSSGSGACAQRDPGEALDIVILGETLHDHEQAWNGFRFAGRIRSDGLIVMAREPKNQTDGEALGTWIFEGHLRYGAAFVGQLRSNIPNPSCGIQGIFSLHKVNST